MNILDTHYLDISYDRRWKDTAHTIKMIMMAFDTKASQNGHMHVRYINL